MSFQDDLNKVLDILLKMEDKTDYENENIGKAIDILQNELRDVLVEQAQKKGMKTSIVRNCDSCNKEVV